MNEAGKVPRLSMPERGDKLFIALDPRRGGILVHPGGVTDTEGNRDLTVRRYLYEEGYKHGADLLTDVLQNSPRRAELLYPVVFLYRQYVELKLKSLLNCMPWKSGSEPIMRTDHNLLQLWASVRDSLLPEVWPEVLADHVETVDCCINEIHVLDPKSFAFRYPEDKGGGNQTLANLESLDVSNLKQVMAKLADFLDCVDLAIGRYAELRQNHVDNLDY